MSYPLKRVLMAVLSVAVITSLGVHAQVWQFLFSGAPQFAQARDRATYQVKVIDSSTWTIADDTLSSFPSSEVQTTYTLSFTTTETIPANTGFIRLKFGRDGQMFDWATMPRFSPQVTISSTTLSESVTRYMFPSFGNPGSGPEFQIPAGSNAIPAGTITLTFSDVGNPGQAGLLSTTVLTHDGALKLEGPTSGTNGSIQLGDVTVSGTFVDATTNSPIADVRVEAHSQFGNGGFWQGVTDSNGAFQFYGVPDGKVFFEMRPGGFDSAGSSVSQYNRFQPIELTIANGVVTGFSGLPPEDTTVSLGSGGVLTIRLSKSNKTITGTVKYADSGNPIAGARVEAFSMGPGGFAETTTDSTGAFSLKATGGKYFVQVRPQFQGPAPSGAGVGPDAGGPPPEGGNPGGPGGQPGGPQPGTPPSGQPGDPNAPQPGSGQPGIPGQPNTGPNPNQNPGPGPSGPPPGGPAPQSFKAQAATTAADDFVPPPPRPVSFVLPNTASEVIALGDILVPRASATVTGRILTPDGNALTQFFGGMGAENFLNHQFMPIQLATNGTFSFKAVPNSGTWRLNLFDPNGTYVMPDTEFKVTSDGTTDLGDITLEELTKTITVTATRIDSGTAVAIPNMPVMAFSKNPGPPAFAITNADGEAMIKVRDNFQGVVMAEPGGGGFGGGPKGPAGNGDEGVKGSGPIGGPGGDTGSPPPSQGPGGPGTPGDQPGTPPSGQPGDPNAPQPGSGQPGIPGQPNTGPNPNQNPGPGPSGPPPGGPVTQLLSLTEKAFAQATTTSRIETDVRQLFPVTPPQPVNMAKDADSEGNVDVALQFDKADKEVSVRTILESDGTLVTDGAFVDARPVAGGFGLGGPTAGGSGTIYTTAGDFTMTTHFPPDSDYMGKPKLVTVGDDGASADLPIALKTVTVTGEVRDASNDNAIIQDASLQIMVAAFGEAGFSPGSYNPSTGTYEVKYIDGVPFNIGVAAGDPGRGVQNGGYVPSISPTELVGNSTTDLDAATSGFQLTHHITLAKVDAVISGIVKDQNGNPRAGLAVIADQGLAGLLANVESGPGPGGPGGPPPGPGGPGGPDPEGPEFSYIGVTNDRGEYTINLTRGTYTLVTNAKDENLFQTEPVTVEVASEQTLAGIDLELIAADATMRIEPVDEAGDPIEEGEVIVFSQDGMINYSVPIDETAEDTDGDGLPEIEVDLVSGQPVLMKVGHDKISEGVTLASLPVAITPTQGVNGIQAHQAVESKATLGETTTMTISESSSAPSVIPLQSRGTGDTSETTATVIIPAGALTGSSSDAGSDETGETDSSSGSPSVTVTQNKNEAIQTASFNPQNVVGLNLVDGSGNAITTTNGTITIDIPYNPDELDPGTNEAALVAKFQDPTTGQWLNADTFVLDTENNIMHISTTHATDFAIGTATDTTAPVEPTAATATDKQSDGAVTLAWTNPTDTDFNHVNIYRSTVSGTQGDKIHTTTATTTTSYEDTGLTNGTIYYYTIKAVDSSGNESTNTTQVSATPTKAATTVLPKTGPTGSVNPILLSILMLLAAGGLRAAYRTAQASR